MFHRTALVRHLTCVQGVVRLCEGGDADVAGEVVDGDLDVGQGGVHGGVVEQPGELERQVSSCCHTRGMDAVTKPANRNRHLMKCWMETVT